MDVEKQVQQFRDAVGRLRGEIGRVIVGHEEIVEQVLVCLLVGGHALLEGVPGLGKTLLVRTVSECLRLVFSRVQFTPDLMPADILGTNVVMEDPSGRRVFEFQKGPIFANVILADEINRATPKTQSALLEAMQEKAVTLSGRRHVLEPPFFVLATQNPIEMEGTYPLPEAQLDRFLFKLEVRPSKVEELVEVLNRTTGTDVGRAQPVLAREEVLAMGDLVRQVPIASHVTTYAARLVLATHPDSSEAVDSVRKYVRYGASPRGAQALVLAGKVLALMDDRYNVSFADIRRVAHPALRHRLILNFEGEAEGIRPDAVIDRLLAEVAELAPEGARARA